KRPLPSPQGRGSRDDRRPRPGQGAGGVVSPHVADAALREGVSGHARNLPDGSVEVLLAGSEAAVARVRAAVEQGPPRSRVESVEWRPAGEMPAPAGFAVL